MLSRGARALPPRASQKNKPIRSAIKITVYIYGHLIPGANKAAGDRLDDPTGRERAHKGQG